MWEIKEGVADNPLSREPPYCVFPTLKGHIISLQKSYLIKARALGLFAASHNDEPCGHEVFHLTCAKLAQLHRTACSLIGLCTSRYAIMRLFILHFPLMRVITVATLKWTPRDLFVL